MRRFILAAMMSGAVLLSSAASAAERPLQAADSSITFTYSQMNVPLDGHFGKFGGKMLRVGRAAPVAAKKDFSVMSVAMAKHFCRLSDGFKHVFVFQDCLFYGNTFAYDLSNVV